MTDPATVFVTDELDDDTKRPVMVWIWDFPEETAPSLGSGFRCIATWKPGYAPDEVQDIGGAVSSWAKPTTASGANSEPQLVVGASLRLPRRYYRGTVEVQLAWTAQKGSTSQSLQRVETLGNVLNAAQSIATSAPEPVLSDVLLAPATPGESRASQTTTAEPADPIAAHGYRGDLVLTAIRAIHARLREGLGPIWRAMSPLCRDATGTKALSELRGTELDSLTVQQLDECWAQVVAEFFVGTCYHGPGSHMGLTPWSSGAGGKEHRADSRFFRYARFRALGQVIPDVEADPPGAAGGEKEYITSLCHACQQLATAVLMTRSPDYLELAEDPVDCSSPTPNGKLSGKSTHSGNSGATTGVALQAKGWLVPGACYFRKPTTRHVAIILRAYQSARVQMMDTGGWNANTNPFPQPSTDPAEATQVQINYDTRPRDQLHDELHGVLIPPAISESNKGKLAEGIKLLQNGRPLGFARLVIYQRGKPPSKSTILYASRRLFMHEGTTTADYRYYTVAALLGSLRACPHADRLDIRWQIFRPIGNEAVRQACNKGRTERWWDESSAGSVPSRKHGPIIELAVSAEGRPLVYQRNAQFIKRQVVFAERDIGPLESVSTQAQIDASRSTGYSNLANVDNSQLPTYFQK